MKIYILCAVKNIYIFYTDFVIYNKVIYARKDYEFSHSLSSGERRGNSLNQFL